jgi:hypothetical protein
MHIFINNIFKNSVNQLSISAKALNTCLTGLIFRWVSVSSPSLPPEVIAKIAEDAIAAQKADISVIRERRGGRFVIPDAAPYVEATKKMAAVGPMKKEVIDLFVASVVAHYEILNEIAVDKTVVPEDDPYVEHYQTPVVLEILYELDPKFRESVEKFVKALEDNKAFLGRELIRKYGGFYGPTCVVDFGYAVGGMAGIDAVILEKLDIPKVHKEIILAAKSWGMNTSYGFGAKFITAVEAGKTLEEAVKEEIEALKKMWLEPTKMQEEVMKEVGHRSFDPATYMKKFRDRIYPYIKAAYGAGVHPANLTVVPAYGVGDVAHHISQSMYNMAKDDVVMAVMEGVTDVLDATLTKGVKEGLVKSEYDVLLAAGRSLAGATAFILELDGFTADMVVDLLVKRFHNFILKYPTRSVAAELHNVDFIDLIMRGADVIKPDPYGRDGYVLKGLKIDLSPIKRNAVLMNPQRYAYPGCAITVRFSALMRLADFPCLLTSEPVTATINTYIVALHPDKPIAPPPICKACGVSQTFLSGRCKWCWYRRGIAKEVPLTAGIEAV